MLFRLVFVEDLSANIELYCGYRQYVDTMMSLGTGTGSRLLIAVAHYAAIK